MKNPLEFSQGGKILIASKIKLNSENLAAVYTPGVAEVVKKIAKSKERSFDLTWKGNTIAIVTDGSAVLGLGNQGPEPALAVMEAKALLFKELAGINAVPIVLQTKQTNKEKEIVKVIQMFAPSFGGINLEDIAAPQCFYIEKQLKKTLAIPVFHDDQWGTAIVVLAGLINALKVVDKQVSNIKIVISGAGAAGMAIAKILIKYGAKNILLYDSKGPLYKGRSQMNLYKKEIVRFTNKEKQKGNLPEALKGADVLIGVSRGKLVRASDIRKMNRNSIVFALANPIPEIMPAQAKKGGAKIVATGRSDFENQINNLLAFPGIFKGALEFKRKDISEKIMIKSAMSLAGLVDNPKTSKILPKALDKRAVECVAANFKPC